MSNATIIEVRSVAAGLVVRDRNGFRFFAATPEFSGLDGRTFRNPQEAEKAAIRHLGVRGDKPSRRV